MRRRVTVPVWFLYFTGTLLGFALARAADASWVPTILITVFSWAMTVVVLSPNRNR